MNHHELTQKVRDLYVTDVVGKRKERTVEDALQEALDNTTPEHAGQPNYNHYEFKDEEEPEWI